MMMMVAARLRQGVLAAEEFATIACDCNISLSDLLEMVYESPWRDSLGVDHADAWWRLHINGIKKRKKDQEDENSER